MSLTSIGSEQAVLGSLMLDISVWEHICDIVEEKHFSRHDHRVIFRAIIDLIEKGTSGDVIIISEILKGKGQLDDVGGLAYLGRLANYTPTSVNAKDYASIVRDRYVMRQLNRAVNIISQDISHPKGRSVDELLDKAETELQAISRTKRNNAPTLLRMELVETLNRLETRFNNPGQLTGVATGFTELDNLLNGLQPSDMVVVAGRPSMGKTSFAMNIAEYVAVCDKQPALVFSLEMSTEQLTERCICSLGKVNFSRYRTGMLKDEDWSHIKRAAGMLQESLLIIDDTAALSVMEIRSKARQVKREYGLSLIVVDYLQLMTGVGDNRVNEVSDISRGLKALAKELSVPVIALSQLNRGLEQRPSKRPVMSDLRESGAIEQDADVIMFVYRDEVYNPDSTDKGVAEILIRKQRNGPLGVVRLQFEGEYCRFRNCDRTPSALPVKEIKR